MKKTQTSKRWLRYLSLVIAFVALAVPDAGAWSWYAVHYDSPLGWENAQMTHDGSNYKVTVYATKGYHFYIYTNDNTQWGLNNSDWRGYMQIDLDEWYTSYDGKTLEKGSKYFEFPEDGWLEITVNTVNNQNSSDPRDLMVSKVSNVLEFTPSSRIWVKFNESFWDSANAHLFAKFKAGNIENGKRVDLTGPENGYYYADVPSTGHYNYVQIVRNNNNDNGVWNSTLNYNVQSGKNLLTVTSDNDNDKAYHCTWGTYNPYTFYLKGSFTDGWNTPIEIPLSDGKYKLEFNVPSSDNDREFVIRRDNDDYSPTAAGLTTVNLGTVYQLVPNTFKQNFKLANPGDYILELNVDGSYTPKSIKVTSKAAAANLPFQPRVVREARGNWNAWLDDEPVIFLKGDYLNNNTLNPGFEFEKVNATRYRLTNVTLRKGDYEAYGCTAHSELTAEVYSKNSATPIVVKGTPTGLVDYVALSYGRKFNVYMDKNGSNWSLSFEKVTGEENEIPFIGLVSENFVQRVPGKNGFYTNDSKATDKGWQEAFVYYDINGNVVRDNEGKYIYSFRWPADGKNYYYSKVKVGGVTKELELLDQNITFRYDSAHGAMTGSQWKSLLSSDENYSNLFNATTSSNLTAGDNSNTGVVAMKDEVTYARYFIPNAWILGYTKVWTGWGGMRNANDSYKALWSMHANWGFIGKGKTTDQGKGSTIDKNMPYGVLGFGGNMAFTEPTYFKTVEMFIPVDANGYPKHSSIDSFNRDNDPIFYTVYSPTEIEARAAKSSNELTENNIGQFQPSYNGAVFSDYTYKVIRYNADADYDAAVLESWEPFDVAGDGGNVALPSDVTVSDLINNNDWYNDRELPNGHYYYGLFIYNGSNELVDYASSNPFTIARVSMSPSVKATQLLELTEAGAAKINQNKSYFTWTSFDGNTDNIKEDNHRWYVTYNPSAKGLFYVVNEFTNKLIKVDRVDALRAIEAHDVIWTTRYFVRAGDYTNYKDQMEEAVASEYIRDDYSEPQYSFTYIDRTGASHDVDYSEMALSEGLIGYVTKYTDGTLDRMQFDVTLSYDYNTLEGEPQSGGGSAVAATRPYVPGAYSFSYAYSTPEKADGEQFGGTDETPVTLTTNSSVVDAEGNQLELEKGVPSGTGAVKQIVVNGLKQRDLTCTFEFKRPNVSTAILKNYDIYYDLLFDNNDTQYDALQDVWCYDNTTTIGQGEKKYQVVANNVNPTANIYPRFYIKGSVYVPHGKYYVWNESTKTGSFQDIVAGTTTAAEIEAGVAKLRTLTETDFDSRYQMYHTPQYKSNQHILQGDDSYYEGPVIGGDANNSPMTEPWTANSTTKIEKKLSKVGDQEYVHYWLPQSESNLYFNNAGDLIHNGVRVKPMYYDVEAYIPTNSFNINKHYYACTRLLIAPEGTKATYYVPNDVDIAKFPYSNADERDADVKFVFTPVYIFKRDPNPSAVVETQGTVVGLTRLKENSPSSAPRRIPTGGQTTEVGGTKYVVVRGAAAELGVKSSDLIYTAVEGINAEAVDAEAEYFNLQGIRVANPEAGQIYIVKRGSKVTRAIVK